MATAISSFELSPQIRSCENLIRKKAYAAYRRLPTSHKRWIDPEDLVSEGMVAALQTKGFVEGVGRKFSTYLYYSLDWHFDRYYFSPLNQSKRSAPLIELDAPLSNSEGEAQFYQLVGSDGRVDTILAEPVVSFMELCRSVSAKAVVILAKGLLCGNWSGHENQSAVLAEIATVANRQRIGIDTLRTLFMEEKSREMALTQLGGFVTIGMGKEMDARILECITCSGKFSLLDIGSGRYVVETLTCRTCHRQMQAAPSEQSCFGKFKTPEHEGYSESDVECRLHCRDRKICRRFIEKRGTTMPAENDPLEGVNLDAVDKVAKKKSAAKKPT